MAVRVKIKIKVGNEEIETTALANSGYEAFKKPEIILPETLANKLGIKEDKFNFKRVHFQDIKGAFNSPVYQNAAIIWLNINPDRKVTVDVVVTDREEEVLLSDKLISALGIDIVDAGEGIWKLREDPPHIFRKSERRQVWS